MDSRSNDSVRRLARRAGVGFAAAALLGLAACGGKGDGAAREAAVKINKGEVTVQQLQLALQQQRGLRPEHQEAVERQLLERLIDQELALQKADDLRLDRDPRVAQLLDAARREVIARAYAEKIGEAAPKPSADEVRKYYEDKPALFKERRIYSLQEIVIEARADQVGALRERLTESKSVAEFVEKLKADGLRFAVNQAVRAAEQLPLANLEAFARMKDGQAVVSAAGPSNVAVVVLAGSRMQPMSEEQARPFIEQFLLAERRRKLVEEDLKAIRAAAKITYVGKYAQPAPAGTAAAAASAALPSVLPASAASAGGVTQ